MKYYSFTSQKWVESKNNFEFWKLQTLIIKQSNLGYRFIFGSAIHNVFFFNVLCGKVVKTSNYSFRLQKGVEIKNKVEF